ncbi:TfuA-like protein [Simkania sp.]|uniref:TfuA-like protein n=1 Tax=Simkania sp. TaxID=34094 RepID=UPI003B51CCF8
MNFKPDEIIIFLGPSLSLEEAQGILEARYFPPAKQGDILSVTNRFQPKVIGLIDGFFSQSLSVWHKEILYALSSGTIVLGASSMGALRAAETAPMGTIGVGEIFKLYQSWEINDDDEVALIHGPAEEGYLALSLPIINVRFTLKRAANEGKLSEDVAAQFLEITKSIHYSEVDALRICAEAKKRGIDEGTISKVSSVLRDHYVDQKKDDARLLLQQVKSLTQEDLPEKKPYPHSNVFNVLYECDQRPIYPESEVTPKEIAHHVALHHPQFQELQFQALNQSMACFLADLLKIQVSPEEIDKEKARLFFRLKLKTSANQEEWLQKNHFTKEDFEDFIEERAKVRKLHRAMNVESVPRKPITALLKELKWNNTYETWAGKSVCQEDMLKKKSDCYYETEHEELQGEKLIETHLKETQWSPDIPYQEWLSEAGFENLLELKNEMVRAKFSRRALRELLFF